MTERLSPDRLVREGRKLLLQSPGLLPDAARIELAVKLLDGVKAPFASPNGAGFHLSLFESEAVKTAFMEDVENVLRNSALAEGGAIDDWIDDFKRQYQDRTCFLVQDQDPNLFAIRWARGNGAYVCELCSTLIDSAATEQYHYDPEDGIVVCSGCLPDGEIDVQPGGPLVIRAEDFALHDGSAVESVFHVMREFFENHEPHEEPETTIYPVSLEAVRDMHERAEYYEFDGESFAADVRRKNLQKEIRENLNRIAGEGDE